MSALDRTAACARRVAAGCTPVPSPCVSICRMGEHSGFCDGCFRTLDEIRAWSRQDDAAKREVWALVEQRIAQAQAVTLP